MHNQGQPPDQRELGFPTPNRHKIGGSIVGGADTENCDRSVTSAKSNENAKSGTFPGSHTSHQGASVTGVERPTLSGSGIKSLQSTAKKNRIIINDDLRSQHKMQQQLAQQEKPLNFSRQQQRGMPRGRDDEVLDDSVALSSPKAGPDSRTGQRYPNGVAQAEDGGFKKDGQPASADSSAPRGKTLTAIVHDVTGALSHK